MSEDAIAAAGACMREKRNRSSVSRAYYAAFAAVTARMFDLGQSPPPGRGNWPHRALPGAIKHALRSAGRREPAVRDIVRNLRACYAMRLDADYIPGRTVDRSVALEALRQALAVINRIGGNA